MSCTATLTALPEVLILQPKILGDDRGFSFEGFNARYFQKTKGRTVDFVQDNHCKSSKGVLRGLAYQIKHPQRKFVRVTYGVVFDVAVDLHRSSPNFCAWVGIDPSADKNANCGSRRFRPWRFLTLAEFAEFLF